MKSITIKELEELLEEKRSNNIHIIDLRGKDVFQLAHIEGANNILLEELQEKAKDLDRDQEYHVVCYSGTFSRKGTEYLEANGFKAVNVQSGMNAYSGPTVSSNSF